MQFPLLFKICLDPAIPVAQAHSEEGWRLQFRRHLGPEHAVQWNSLSSMLEEILPEDAPDRVSWKFESSGIFSSRSMYRALCADPVVTCSKLIWEAHMPKKIKIFLWQLLRGRLPTNDHIHHRGGPSDGKCALCGAPENVEHIFFSCVLAQFSWSGVRAMLGVNWCPSNRVQWLGILEGFQGTTSKLMWLLFAAQCWALWKIRNKFTIEHKFPNQPADRVFKTMLNLQQWSPLLREKERALVEQLGVMLKHLFATTARAPRQRAAPPT